MRIALADIKQLYDLRKWALTNHSSGLEIRTTGDFIPFPNDIALSEDLYELVRYSGVDRGIFSDSTALSILKDGVLTHNLEIDEVRDQFWILAAALKDAFGGNVTAAKISERIAYARQVSHLHGEHVESEFFGLELNSKEEAIDFLQESGALLCHGTQGHDRTVEHFVVAPVDMEIEGVLVPKCSLIPMKGNELSFDETMSVEEFSESRQACTKDGRPLTLGDFIERRKAVVNSSSAPFAVSSNFRVIEALAAFRAEHSEEQPEAERLLRNEFGAWQDKLQSCYRDSTIAGRRFPDLGVLPDQIKSNAKTAMKPGM